MNSNSVDDPFGLSPRVIAVDHGRCANGCPEDRSHNNLTIEEAPFATLSDADKALRPFLTGKGVAGGAARAVALPTAAQTARAIGTHGTHVVTSFL